MTRLIQVADDQNTPTDSVRLVAGGEEPLLPLFTYLLSESESEQDPFFLQIATPNRNLSRFSPHPFDSISLAQMLSLLSDKGYATDAIVANVTYYDASIEAIIRGGKAETAFTRPTTGAVCRPATTAEIGSCLALPSGAGPATRIGRLAQSGEAVVEVHVDERVLDHHMLVAGATGSGKSHLLSNLAHAAAAMGPLRGSCSTTSQTTRTTTSLAITPTPHTVSRSPWMATVATPCGTGPWTSAIGTSMPSWSGRAPPNSTSRFSPERSSTVVARRTKLRHSN